MQLSPASPRVGRKMHFTGCLFFLRAVFCVFSLARELPSTNPSLPKLRHDAIAVKSFDDFSFALFQQAGNIIREKRKKNGASSQTYFTLSTQDPNN
jgi:hypothetical protein